MKLSARKHVVAVPDPVAAQAALVVACQACGAPVAHAFCAQCGTGRPADARLAHSHLCRNCGHEADDAFCPHCGQETRIALPTAREFMREAAGRFVALDSRLWRTLAVLLTRPGFLTNAYLAGRRLRYVRPARLFLFSSIVAFALVRLFAEPELIGLGDRHADGQAASAVATPRAAGAKDEPAKDKSSSIVVVPLAKKPMVEVNVDEDGTLIDTDALKLSFDRESNLVLGGSSPVVGPIRERIQAFNQLPFAEKKQQLYASAFRYGPYAAFVLLPAFAFMLQLLYAFPSRRFPQRPRRFAAHLVFGAHNHAFLFVVVSVLALLPVFGGRGQVVSLFACTYLLLSLRRVYGGSWIGILVRAFVIFIAYTILFALAVAVLLVAAVLLR